MTVKSFSRGHPIYYYNKQWLYQDDNTLVSIERPCTKCGNMPTVEGYDSCLGKIENVSSICCGHGVERSYYKN